MRLDDQSGASFIEVLAAVCIFAVIVVGLSPSLLSTQRAASFSKNQSIAAALAADKIEQFRAVSSGSSVSAGSDGPFNANGSSGGIFNRSWTVSANTPLSGVSQIAVTTAWRDRPNSSVTLVTLIPQ
jgi:Tfp pilus assembly protein PilV